VSSSAIEELAFVTGPAQKKSGDDKPTHHLPLENRDAKTIEAALTLMLDLVRSESERETNLNTRATAVAATAGTLAALAAGLAKFVFERLESPWTEIAAVSLVLALGAAVLSALLVVLVVLRPKQLAFDQPGRRYLGGSVLESARGKAVKDGFATALDDASSVRRWYLDHAVYALESWWTRNNQKQLHLIRAYEALALAIVLLGITGVVVATQETWIALAIAAGAVAVVALTVERLLRKET
jgi:hypothetical protein